MMNDGLPPEGETEPNPPAGHPLAPKTFKVEIGRPLVPFAQPLLHEASMEQINAELTRRFQGVALVGIQVGPDGIVRDLYYTSIRGLPPSALAGCMDKLARDVQKTAVPVDIKPT
jgi:hypothetical protein